MNNLEIDLMPAYIKQLMRAIKNVSICAELGAFMLSAVMGALGFFHDVATGCIFSLILLLITTPLLAPGFIFEKVSQSTVRLTDDRIYIIDRKGKCWRTIDYSAITTMRIEEIAGFFYGQNKMLHRNKYICFFLNGSTEIPNVSFAKLFTDKDFFMLGYREKVWTYIYDKFTPNTNDSSPS